MKHKLESTKIYKTNNELKKNLMSHSNFKKYFSTK